MRRVKDEFDSLSPLKAGNLMEDLRGRIHDLERSEAVAFNSLREAAG